MESIRWRHLPHWDVPGATYFVTSCLEGSIPAQGLRDIERFRDSLAQKQQPKELSVQEWKLRCWKQVFARCDEWLDLRPAVRHLRDPALAKEVVDALYYFAGQRYNLLAFCVMPSHIHWVFTPLVGQVCNLSADESPNAAEADGALDAYFAEDKDDRLKTYPTGREDDDTPRSPRERIMQSIKRHTARKCNLRLGRRGRFWQEESYDHWARDEDELERIIHYVEQNPVKAGLVAKPEDWLFSSARDRISQGLLLGQPLRRIDL
jgi:type I restriction enzyme R subunit